MSDQRPDLQTVINFYDEVKGVHEACLIFPAASSEDYEAMFGSMPDMGLLEDIVLTEEGMLLDGRNRLIACYESSTDPRFVSTDIDPWLFAYTANMTRRHLKDGQKAAIAVPFKKHLKAEAKERQREAGENYGRGQEKVPEHVPEANGDSRDKAGEMVGISGKSVDVAEKAHDNHSDVYKRLLEGEISLAEAKKEMKKRDKDKPKPPSKLKVAEKAQIVTVSGKVKEIDAPKSPKFNRTTDAVDWATFTWNPVTGCEHGCGFCYAREIAHSSRMADVYPFKFEPAYHEYRLAAPKNTKVPDSDRPQDGRVFVCSMADLFGKWVPQAWIRSVFDACLESPEWEYMFLTKWPARYSKMPLIGAAWYGASVVQQSDVNRVERAMLNFDAPESIKWCSLEPMLEPITFNDLSWCNLMVIGSQTGTTQPDGRVEEFAPEFDWIVDVVNQCRDAGIPYYLKANLGMERPGMSLPKMDPS